MCPVSYWDQQTNLKTSPAVIGHCVSSWPYRYFFQKLSFIKIFAIEWILIVSSIILGPTNQSGGIACSIWPLCLFITLYTFFWNSLFIKIWEIEWILMMFSIILGPKNQSGGIARSNWPLCFFMTLYIYFSNFFVWQILRVFNYLNEFYYHLKNHIKVTTIIFNLNMCCNQILTSLFIVLLLVSCRFWWLTVEQFNELCVSVGDSCGTIFFSCVFVAEWLVLDIVLAVLLCVVKISGWISVGILFFTCSNMPILLTSVIWDTTSSCFLINSSILSQQLCGLPVASNLMALL